MRKLIIPFVFLLIFSLAGCETKTALSYPMPLNFISTDDLRKEKKARNSSSYQENDPQNLRSVSACYQFSKLPADINLSGYTVSAAYVSASYIYQKYDDKFLSQFSELGYSNDEILTISLIFHRNYGQKELEEFIGRDPDTYKVISLGEISKVFYAEAKYNDAVMQKVYYFILMDQYLSLSVPGNLPDEIISDLIKGIQKVDIA
jgi:hypothetical protein